MPRILRLILTLSALLGLHSARAAEELIEIPTRPGVTQRMLVLGPAQPQAAVILLAGGNGALQLSAEGKLGGLNGNFLVRTRQQWADQGLLVALVDAPSDRRSEPFLSGFRQTPEHAADLKAVIAWLRQRNHVPVWLVGTSRGTQSAAFAAISLSRADGPDGIVLTSTILSDPKSRAVPAMNLNTLTIPTLVVHHQNDACKLCSPDLLPQLMDKLNASPRKELLLMDGGASRGDPCEALAWHGFNGIEGPVVSKVAQWLLAQ